MKSFWRNKILRSISTTLLKSKDSVKTQDSYEFDHTQRSLKSRHVQFIALGGSIGNNVFINGGIALAAGGPGSMLIAYVFWSFVILSINECLAEMVTYLPISSPFLRLSGRYVDDALSVAASWMFFLNQAFLLPYEIVFCCTLLKGLNAPLPTVIVIFSCLILWGILNVSAVKYFGEVEFWMAITKVFFACALFLMTIILMMGGNPMRDAFGFRYWKNPGSFAEYNTDGQKGRLLGFMFTLSQAAFVISGPEYISMSAGEAILPRTSLPKAYRTTIYRLIFFFLLNPITIGSIVPFDDPKLKEVLSRKVAIATSPYAIGCIRLGITILPELITAFSFLAALSAGNCYCYAASRNLYGLALQGHAPQFFRNCFRNGVPIYAVAAALTIGLLSFLQLSNGSAKVILWLIDMVRLGQLGIYCVICVTFLFWRRAIQAQGLLQTELPYRSKYQPFLAYFGLTCCLLMIFLGGFSVFLKGNWSVANFFFGYGSIPISIIIYTYWKYQKKTSVRNPKDIDIFSDKAEIDNYEEKLVLLKRRN